MDLMIASLTNALKLAHEDPTDTPYRFGVAQFTENFYFTNLFRNSSLKNCFKISKNFPGFV